MHESVHHVSSHDGIAIPGEPADAANDSLNGTTTTATLGTTPLSRLSSFRVPLKYPIQVIGERFCVRLSSLVLPMTQFNIDADNRRIEWIDSGGANSYDFPVGQYTAQSFLTVLNQLLGFSSGDINVTYDSASSRFRVNFAASGYMLKFGASASTTKNVSSFMGFPRVDLVGTMTPTASDYVYAEYAPATSAPCRIGIYLSDQSHCQPYSSTTTAENDLGAPTFVVDCNAGNGEVFQPDRTTLSDVKSSYMKEGLYPYIDVRIRDLDNPTRKTFMRDHWSFTLHGVHDDSNTRRY